jgi:zinc transport system substrate-binding protein
MPLPGGRLLALLTLAVVLTTGCGNPAATTDTGKPLVVTSTPPLFSFVANVAGDAVRLENLLPPGASPHQTSFTPAQAKLLAQADLLVINGAGLEHWVGDLIKSTGRQDLKVVEASRGLEFLRPDRPIPIPGSTTDTGEPTNVDPHVWLDAHNAVLMVENVRAALTAIDPAHATDFQARAAAYTARLNALDEEVRRATTSFSHKDFVSFHSAFQYYARAYGLSQVAVIEEFPGKEPSPAYLAGIVDLVKKLAVTAVFSEPQFSPRPAEALARETGVHVYQVDPEGHSLSAGMYEDLMRANTAVFAKALGSGGGTSKGGVSGG